ncbi:hypothetical protein KUL25_10300 [Rhodobacteraceae bacterium N5(2021)]|uniref:Uncharacterized protein n=1 Tax=Gymnodinialimonas phycosphaerae TaxID=2841589 RepID=A0A975YHX5_9RHOB|nr:hypothetical protein [Gymnodinialimonas phycosphaerae]MBY4893155.1 hypothetical protein [Gymnodinialimonas phycosphaerae]
MRIVLPFLTVLALALPGRADTYWPGPGDIVTPHAGGLDLSSADGMAREGMPFGSSFHETMHTLVPIFGHDVSVAFPQECGEGPLVSVHIPGQINLMFQEDQLAGWMLIDDSALRTATGLHVGAPRMALADEGAVSCTETGIGTEFGAGDLFGLLSEDGTTIQGIWSGATCIFR